MHISQRPWGVPHVMRVWLPISGQFKAHGREVEKSALWCTFPNGGRLCTNAPRMTLNTDSSVSLTLRLLHTLACLSVCASSGWGRSRKSIPAEQTLFLCPFLSSSLFSLFFFFTSWFYLPFIFIWSEIFHIEFVARTWQRRWRHCGCPSPGSWPGERPRSLHTEWCGHKT